MGELLDDNAVDNITIDSGVEGKVIIGGEEDVDVIEDGSGEGDADADAGAGADNSSEEEAGRFAIYIWRQCGGSRVYWRCCGFCHKQTHRVSNGRLWCF